jgi:hypothetical protein
MRLVISIGNPVGPLQSGDLLRVMPAMPSEKEVALLLKETGAEALQIIEPAQARSFAVIVTAHPDYVGYLPEVLDAWERENPDGERILVLDCVDEKGFPDRPGWTVIRGDWFHPSGPRNAGLEAVTLEWVHYWDADNIVPHGLGDRARSVISVAEAGVGYLGPWCTTAQDHRDGWGIDTNGLWRVKAVRMAGGWPSTWFEDWNLGVRLQAVGFRAQKWDSGVERRDHPGQRSKLLDGNHERVWDSRIMTVITLQRTVDGFQKWLEAWERQRKPFPENLRLIIGCEGDDVEKEARLATVATLRAGAVTVWNTGSLPVQFGAVPEAVRHSRVSGLFLRAAGFVGSDSGVVLTWEDDVFPERRDALWALSEALHVGSKIGAVGGAYPGRQNPKIVVASRHSDRWEGPWNMDELEGRPFDVGSVGAGFTLWRASVFEQISGAVQRPEIPLGWDACASGTVHRLGFRVLLHGGVRCEHGAY